jgi:hypothetical protein
MQTQNKRHLWYFPILFGFLGAFIGLIARYLFTGVDISFSIKNIIHSHSHVMLLGFLFNGLILFIWERFTKGIDRVSLKYYLVLQICILGMLITFIVQGYALFSIFFATAHLVIGYIFLIRLWKRLLGSTHLLRLIKLGVVFQFVSSIGPYCLGPLMVFEMQSSPWYQQAIFFYLHFQFFGSLFVWLLALWLQKINGQVSSRLFWVIIFSIVCLYAHSVNYNFDSSLISLISGIGSLGLLMFLIVQFKHINKTLGSELLFYLMLLLLGTLNLLGSFPFIAKLVIENHYILIAWLHFIFLGIYVPYIWMELNIKNELIWFGYALTVLLCQLILVFPDWFFHMTQISVSWLLFIAYVGTFILFVIVHVTLLLKNKE